MFRILFVIIFIGLVGCQSSRKIVNIKRQDSSVTGSQFYQSIMAANWKERDSVAGMHILKGNMPSFLKKFEKLKLSMTDEQGKKIRAILYVSPDYLSLGTDDDWARIPLTPKTAQKIADEFDCFLPTRKIVDEIYKASVVKLEPVPMTEDRDSAKTMWKHHLIIEEQRKGQKGLIAGVKKDIVISSGLAQYPKKDRVAIYGWHKADGKPIQPIYTGHVDWYVDYSHGVRLVYKNIWIKPRPKGYPRIMDYKEILNHPVLVKLLCDEEKCGVYHYGSN